MPDLATRLLAEIERRHDRAFQEIDSPSAIQQGASFREMGYLAALRKIVERAAEEIADPISPPEALQLADDVLTTVVKALGVEV